MDSETTLFRTWRELFADSSYELSPEGAEVLCGEIGEHVATIEDEEARYWHAYNTSGPIAYAVLRTAAEHSPTMYAEILAVLRKTLISFAEDSRRRFITPEGCVIIPFPIGGRYGYDPDDCA